MPTKPSRFLNEIPGHLTKGQQQAPTGSPHGGRATSSRSTSFGAGNSASSWNTTTPSTSKSVRPTTASSAAVPKPGGLRFKAGDKVMHAKFGKGIVITSKVQGSDEEVTVAFENTEVNIKKLLASFANLQKL